MRLKSSLIVLFAICLVQISFGQNKLKIKKSENFRLSQVLNNSELIEENRENYLAVRIYKIENETGSTQFLNSEITHNLLVAVSEFDEEPNQSLFEIGTLYNSKFIS